MMKYSKLMQKCINLAKKANGKNMPNPFVGAIVYDEEKKEIISSGYHKKYGEAHAEVNAIKNANGNTIGKTILVSLEPCSHYGKTPPCTDLIIKSGFKKCIIAMLDPNKKASGGAEILKNAGIEVVEGILEKEARELNKVFLKNILFKKPYVMLKTATTLDGKIALLNGKSKWITNEKARLKVQKLRSKYQAIMSASGTILADNPKLNVRLKNKTSPIRIIFDPNNKIPLNYNVFNNDARVILINNSKLELPKHIEQLNFDGNFDKLFKELFMMGICSIMVEAGCGFNSELIKADEIDEINHFIAPKIFGDGLNFVSGLNYNEINDSIQLKNIKVEQIEDNLLINGKIKIY
ncbi:MAG: bifunctional diaminohydroxyphosphoribosylaminopyrimidine deaminase/5-amino-6-(5-phosphoribosylamino)uracil reductase RibD [Candidatus Gastranaerophilales bacterium]|nr:bifunctional diaminohydroxyphosphoribosylaminopyrimidine deaminase/5-amino-6-(5-phosphoribosylamino)uracil reductase RibD [Candidatus Gastranaerophilales bacterium]